MTVSTTTNRVSYNGNSVTTAFSFPYLFLADADLVVILVSAAGTETTQTITTHYTVTGATNPAGGTVTMLIAPATGQKLVIYRDPALTQTTDVVEGDPLPVETVLERPLDKLTMISQRNRELANRSMRLSDGDTSGASVVLPTPAASKLLGWNSGATALVNYAATDFTGTLVSAFAETLLDDASASEARTTLGLGALAIKATVGASDIDTGAVGPTQLAATAVTPAAYTNANITVDADGRITAAANGTPGVISETYTSSDQTITLGGALTLAHGLSAMPSIVMAYLVNVTGDVGYTTGMATQSCAASSSAASAGAGSSILAVVPDATNINIRFPASALYVGHYTTGAASAITPANWRLRVYAFA